MNKSSFIKKKFRPMVPGGTLRTIQGIENVVFTAEIKENCILFISSRDDVVPEYFLKDLDNRDSIVCLFYDELGTFWDFSFSEEKLKIYQDDKVISPIAIYHRHPGISFNHPNYSKHVAFFEVLDIWKGNLLGQQRDHYQNFSKGYQGITSIKASSKRSQWKIKYPKSFFVKGDYKFMLNKMGKSLVVKSCSNIRSKVVSSEIFFGWDFSSLSHLPTFFQEKIVGTDIRVHVCGNELWPLEVKSKDCVDYRYASKGSVQYNEIALPRFLKQFCRFISEVENNKFVGVDLMKVNNEYYCFESNPGPGWSTYHHPSKKMFAKKVFNQLVRKGNKI